MREWFSVQAAGVDAAGKAKGGGEILIYGVIGQSFWSEAKDRYVPAKAFVKELETLVAAGPGDVHIRINSPGGDVWDGTAIYNAILQHRARCYCTIEGVAFSMGSMIALAGRETRMYATSQYMIHNPRWGAYGEEKDLEQALAGLRTAKAALMVAYQNKSGLGEDEIYQLMSATTWMTAAQAHAKGFVDVVLGAGDAAKAGASAHRLAASHDVDGWVRFYRGEGPVPGAVDPPAADASRVDEVDEEDEVETPTSSGADALPLEGGTRGVVGNSGGDAPERIEMKISDIERACPGASAEFVMGQMKACEGDANRTITDVVSAFAVAQTAALEAERKARADDKVAAEAATAAAVEAAKKTPPVQGFGSGLGVPPLGTAAASGAGEGGGEGGDPIAAFDAAVAARMKEHKEPRHMAVQAVGRNQPELFEQMEAAHNAQHAAFAAQRRRPISA